MAKAKTQADKDLSNLGTKTAGVASSVLVGKILTVLIAGLGYLVYVRLLASTAYGVYVLAVSVAGIVAAIGNVGIATSFSKFISEYKAKKDYKKIGEVISSGFFVTFLIGIVLTSIIFIFSGTLSQLIFKTSAYTTTVEVASFVMLGTLFFNISYFLLIGFGKKRALVGIVLIQVIVQAVVSIVLALLHFGAIAPLTGQILGYFSGTVATIVYVLGSEKISVAMPSKEAIKDLMTFSLPLGAYNIANGIVSNLTNIVLGAFASESIVGNVAATQKIGGVLNATNESISTSLIPLFSSATHSGVNRKHIGKLYNYSVYITFLMFAPVALFLALFSKEVTYIALGSGYPTAQLYMPFVGIGLLLLVLVDYASSLLIGRNKVNPVMKYGVLAYLLELIVLIALVPFLKGYGLVISVSIILPITLALFYHKAVADHLKIKLDVMRLVWVVVVALVAMLLAVPFIYIFPPISLSNDVIIVIAAMIESFVVYPPLLGLSGCVKKKDRDSIKNVSAGIPGAGRVIQVLADYAGRFAKG